MEIRIRGRIIELRPIGRSREDGIVWVEPYIGTVGNIATKQSGEKCDPNT